MKLHCEPIIPVRPKFLSIPLLKNIYENKAKASNQINLKLTLRFGEQVNQFQGKPISFGLCGGQLRLQLTNAKLLLETVKLTPQFPTTFATEKAEETSKEREGGLEVKITGGATGRLKTVVKTATKYQNTIGKVYLQGTEEEPIWRFQSEANKLILRGILQEELIGVLEVEVHDQPYSVKAFFEFQNQDIYLTRRTGILPQVFEKRATLDVIRSELKSDNIISEVGVTYE